MALSPDQLQAIAYFHGLAAADLSWLAASVTLALFGPREAVIREEEPCTAMYAVQHGRVRIFKTSRGGRQQVLAVAQPPDTFNEVPVFDGGPNPASVETLVPSAIIVVPRETTLALIGRSPHAALTLLASFAGRLRGMTRLVETLSFDDVNRRLARLLAQQARREGVPHPEGTRLLRTLTVNDIAAMVGSVREVVSRALSLLEHEGLVHVRSTEMIVPDITALQRYADG
jgi:CRP/FNR family cyclic AMP-dependent transcriptional regulator